MNNPKILFYVINLDGSDERLNTISQSLKNQGIDFIRISAFDGRKVEPTSITEYDESKALSYMGKKLTGGEIGCYLSHIRCAKAFLESEADFAVVLEDDVEPVSNFGNIIDELISKLANQHWYLINIGATKRKIFSPLFDIHNHQVAKAHYFPISTMGLVWSRQGADIFVKTGLPIYAPVDNFFRDWLTKTNLGIGVFPPLVIARDVASDIDTGAKRKQNNRAKNYTFIKQKRLWQDKFIAFKHKYLGQKDATNNQQPTTNNQQPTTNNQQPTTNNQQPTTNNQQPKFYNIVIFVANFLFSLLLVWAVSGGSPRIHDVLLLWVLWNCLWLKPIVFKLFSPLILLWLMYAPIGVQYGYPSSGMVASFFETTINEATEFFDTITIAYIIVVAVLSFATYLFTKKVKPTAKQIKFFRYFSCILIILFLANILSLKHKKIHLSYSELLGIIPHTFTQYEFYLINKQKMQQLERLSDDWKVKNFSPTYQNYVLVIGESASKNFLSAYGYPINTSPFLNKVNGTQYKNAISPAIFTIKSVPRLLTIPNREQVEYQNNIIHLANKLQMPTYWISNQDKMGEWDNEISYIASYAKEKYYLSETAPTSARFDYQLLPKIKEVIQTPSNKPKLIIVHLMGSHVQFKKRVDFNKAHFNFKNKLLSDYLSSLLQTDMLLEDIHTELKNSNQPFSMVYIADHAIMPKNLKHGMSQFTLQVPLFKINSDSSERQIDNRLITGFGFVWFLTEWLGIDTKNQSENTFLNNYHVNKEDELMIFEEKAIPYLSVEPFDGKILLPEKQELNNATSK